MLPTVKVFAGTTLFHSEILTVVWQPFSSWLGLAVMPSFKQPLFLKGFLYCFSASWMCDSVTPPLSYRYLSFFVVSECFFISACKPDKFFFWVPLILVVPWQMQPVIQTHYNKSFLPLCIKYKLISYITCSLSYSRI